MGNAILSIYKPNSSLGMVTYVTRKTKKLGKSKTLHGDVYVKIHFPISAFVCRYKIISLCLITCKRKIFIFILYFCVTCHRMLKGSQ